MEVKREGEGEESTWVEVDLVGWQQVEKGGRDQCRRGTRDGGDVGQPSNHHA